MPIFNIRTGEVTNEPQVKTVRGQHIYTLIPTDKGWELLVLNPQDGEDTPEVLRNVLQSALNNLPTG